MRYAVIARRLQREGDEPPVWYTSIVEKSHEEAVEFLRYLATISREGMIIPMATLEVTRMLLKRGNNDD
jgi:hypothetical protein